MPHFFVLHPRLIALAAALPWIIAPLLTVVRLARSRMLRDESDTPPKNPPRVAVIIPARNEAHNIVACLHSVLASTYPLLTVIVVDDHSTDHTAALVPNIADRDPRVRLVSNPDLPPGWFGKQWACQNGAQAADSDILIFVDADTRLTPATITRSVNGMLRSNAALYSVISSQEMHSFWERIIQPQVFTMLAWRYGGTESVNHATRALDKIANGQYLMLRRTDYDALGGHGLVREYVAEDLMLAQKYFTAGRITVVSAGFDHLSTRMYTSLPELISGWRKNVYAGGREAMPGGRVGLFFFPLMLLVMPLMQLVPVAVLGASLFGLTSTPVLIWATVATTAWLGWWLFTYRINRQPMAYALVFPLGALVMTYIFVTAIARGHRVSWKGRQYTNAPASA